jgi:hypothetical protein
MEKPNLLLFKRLRYLKKLSPVYLETTGGGVKLSVVYSSYKTPSSLILAIS